jgi:hypothetical protein
MWIGFNRLVGDSEPWSQFLDCVELFLLDLAKDSGSTDGLQGSSNRCTGAYNNSRYAVHICGSFGSLEGNFTLGGAVLVVTDQ